MKIIRAAALSLAGISALAQAQDAAILENASEGVLVNQGDMYVPAEAGMQLTTGDHVMVLESAEAQIVFADGCQVELGENQVMQIADPSTCPRVATTGSTAGLGMTAAPVAASAVAPAAGSVTGSSMGATFAGASATMAAAATAAAGVGVYAVSEAAENDDPPPAPGTPPPPISP